MERTIDRVMQKVTKVLSNIEEWVYDKTTKEARHKYYEAIEEKGGKLVERIYQLLRNWYYDGEPPKAKQAKYTHDMFCSCSRCNRSINAYHRDMKRIN